MDEVLLVLITGFTIGVFGSFHCVGMCGPLALSLPIHQLTIFNKSMAIGLYNLGRSFSYASMGIVFGLLGMSFSLFKLQQWLSIGAGSVILLFLIMNYLGSYRVNIFSQLSHQVKSKLSDYLQTDKTPSTYFSIGMVNGFLPCGLVYVAIVTAIATGTILKSSLTMFAFGIGTIPIMALTMIFGKFVSINLRNKLNKMTPYLIMCVAILLILRGLNLGIPFISPLLENDKMNCCHR
ncbi:MAG: sulfite exporter TauE/SafE family protein [Saprospiraceae bacterium]|jgi:sulfite exporter TauE/SafE|nr:sulfite exporter TauE/SafE family protein [Candidatus Defluviibacterium haderslevense]MCC7026359.1 sulfite exporter TauE/SafE family protein [Saprospiraceae bacterium]MBK7244921.1 sulfite exporter TauE/SafE family protein [Candidatus Defluviibacterium haderslevense]MBK8242175.1 sulfite exporter TauE/SafE family protein [Candidatus Defluviibacterium haderslevense]MBL0238241.1 sulfite exporter TauE/SafE family protein [Candidatus Defluviibacterium haderslevense]